MKIIIPIAGEGLRFKKFGVYTPKPLIKVDGKSLIRYSIDSLDLKEHKHILICRDLKNGYLEDLKAELNKCKIEYEIILIDKLTSGASETSLLGMSNVDEEEEIIITNCDQYLNWDSKEFLKKSRGYDSSVLTYKSTDPKNSFAQLIDKKIVKIVEKEVISNNALVGVHYWKKASYFIDSANQLIREINDKESYISETFNYLLKKNLNVGCIDIGEGSYWSTGTPEDLKVFKGMILEFQTAKINTYFFDLDGTIIMHAHKYSGLRDNFKLCPGVKDALDEIDSRGDKIILISVRKESSRKFTEKILEDLNIPYDQLILSIGQGQRYLINDKISEEAKSRTKSVDVITDKGWSIDDII